MTNEKANKMFAKYNRPSDVVRCPNGRATTRKQLDAYARAAVNLYGMISRDDFVAIFNQQNIDQTSKEEIYILLLPLVLKNGWYGFYKEYIVHYVFLERLETSDNLLKHQGDKPRYVPEQDEFLKYVDEDYMDNDHWWHVQRFMYDSFGINRNTTEGYNEVRLYITHGEGINKLGAILNRYDLIFEGDQQFQAFINLIMLAKNNTRIWENNGYTPSELHQVISKRNENIVQFPTLKKQQVGRNEPCPCGSGKKYKKCCALLNNEKIAQLSSEECRLFYETWYGLMGFVNERKHVIKAKIKPEHPNAVSDMMIYKVREVFWETPELIDDYISETDLPQEKIDILKLWKTNHKKGMLFVLAFQPDYAVVLGSNEQGEEKLYGIKGISNSLEAILRQDLPIQVETIMLPFKGKIVYDGFIGSVPMQFGEGAKAGFREMYEKVIKSGIVTSLE